MPRKKSFNQDMVLEKAMHLFWEKGYHATSINDLVATLGINRASLYDTFGGKRSLFVSCLERYAFTGHRQIRESLFKFKEVKQGFENLFKAIIVQSIQDPKSKGCFAVNCTVEMIPNDPAFKEIMQKSNANLLQIFDSYLAHGKENGSLTATKDVKALAQILLAYMNGLQVIYKPHSHAEDGDKSVETFLEILD